MWHHWNKTIITQLGTGKTVKTYTICRGNCGCCLFKFSLGCSLPDKCYVTHEVVRFFSSDLINYIFLLRKFEVITKFYLNSFLGYGAVQFLWSTPTFQTCVLPPSSGRWISCVKKISSKYRIGRTRGIVDRLMGKRGVTMTQGKRVSVNFNKATWCYTPESCYLHTCCCENLKCHKVLCNFIASYENYIWCQFHADISTSLEIYYVAFTASMTDGKMASVTQTSAFSVFKTK
jgi:hypothetical protein